MFGLGCALVGEISQPLVNVAVSVREVSAKCLHGVMLIAPIGIFVLVGAGISQPRNGSSATLRDIRF